MRIGIDLGGTKIEGVVLSRGGEVVARQRLTTPSDDYHAIITAITSLVLSLETEVGLSCTVGIGMPGIISPHTGLVKNSNTTVLNGARLDRDLERALNRPLRFENDANCFALSEATDGAGRGCQFVFGVILGTGAGGGLVFNRAIWSGENAIAGEWGHNPLPWPRASDGPGRPCYCGQSGCIETYLSGSGLAFAYTELGGEARSAANIAARLDFDVHARAALACYCDRLARSLASIINVLDPNVIVLGGGLSNIEALYEPLRELLGKYVFSDRFETQIRPAIHGDSSGVRGAAWLWPAEEGVA